MSYKVGDVIIVRFPFHENPTKYKPRPAVITRIINPKCIACKITSTNRSGRQNGFWIEKNSEEGREMSLLNDSFVAYEDEVEFHFNEIIEVIGYCSLIGGT